ncbi:MAG: FAD-dependent oxidoreductase [Candidatus Bipolaricaulota bacterium]|nr:FAD-dependent oxidoreductase [Candidatus Bipolaricaulota bacterium]
MKTDVLVVGGSAAGLTAAISTRRSNPDANITLIRKEKRVLIPCGIPYIFGTLDSPEEDLIPDEVMTKHKIDLIVDEVTAINKGAKTATTADGNTINYDRMVLATGSYPLVPPLPGVNLENVFSVKKDIDYLTELKQALSQANDLVIIGGGFIGLEFADECSKIDSLNSVNVVELLPHCLLLACDSEVCVQVEEELKKAEVSLFTDRRAKAILGKEKVEQVELENGQKLNADIVILGIGVRPNIDLAKNAGLQVDDRAGIWVDSWMRTSDPNIFAAGDCTQKTCFLTKGACALRLASIATMEARVAGANLFSLRQRAPSPIGVFGTVIGDLCVGSAGFTERHAREEGVEVIVGKATAADKHPGTLPGAQELTVKLVFMKGSRKLIGGQVYGSDKAGYVANCIGSLIQQGLRADDLVTFQVGTHPKLTPSPIAHQIENAAEIALAELLSS